MYGESTDKETIAKLDYALENQLQDQFEIRLYKSCSKYAHVFIMIDHVQWVLNIKLSQWMLPQMFYVNRLRNFE